MKTNHLLANWEEKTWRMKSISILGVLVSTTIIIFCILQLAGIFPNATDIFMPLLGVLMCIQAIQNWKTNRLSAYFSLLVAIFIGIVALINFL